MSNNKVLCICIKCKKRGTDNIGKYVHPTTRWRHIKNAKKNYNLDNLDDFEEDDDNGDDDDDDDDDDEDDGEEEEEDEDEDEEEDDDDNDI
jgi:hypothetical protein